METPIQASSVALQILQAVLTVTVTMIVQVVMVVASVRYVMVKEYKITVTRLLIQSAVNVAEPDYVHLVVAPGKSTVSNRVV